VSSTWKNDQIEGFTEENWPNKNVRFEGMYKNNQRNGYGEQYAYDNMISMGFYKDGVM
jgi:antitoxin component YwqK of YwqJK toxin-antitoxin module